MAPTNFTFGLSSPLSAGLSAGLGAAILGGESRDSLFPTDTFEPEPPVEELSFNEKMFHPDAEPLATYRSSGRMGSGLFNPDGLWRGGDRFASHVHIDGFVQDKTKYATQPTLAEDIESLGGALIEHLTKPESEGGYSLERKIIAGHVVCTFDQDLTLDKLGQYLRTGLEKIYNIGGLLLVNSNLSAEVKAEIEKAIEQKLISEVKLVQIEKTKVGKEAEEADVIRAISISGYFDEAIAWQSFIDESQLRWGNDYVDARNPIAITKSQYSWLKDYPEIKEFIRNHIHNISERDLEKFHTILHPQRDGEVLMDTELQASQNNLLGLLGEIEFRNRLIQNYNQILNTHPNAVLILEHDIRVNGRLASDAIIGTINPATKAITIHKIIEMTVSESQDDSTRTQMRKTVDERLKESGLTLMHGGLRATLIVRMEPAVRAEAIWIHEAPTYNALKAIAEKSVRQLTAALALDGLDENKVKGKMPNTIVSQLMTRLVNQIQTQKPQTHLELTQIVNRLAEADVAQMSGNHMGWKKIAWALQMMTSEIVAHEYNSFVGNGRASYLWPLVMQMNEVLSPEIARSSSFAQFKRSMASTECHKIREAETAEELVKALKEADLDEIYKVVNNQASADGAYLILAGSSQSVFYLKEIADPQNPGKNRKEFKGRFGFYTDESGLKENAPQIKLVKVAGLWVVDAADVNVKGTGCDQFLTVARAAEIKVVELITEVGLAKTVEQLKEYLADQKNIQNEANKLGDGITQIILAGSSSAVFMWQERADPQNPGKYRKEFDGRFGFYADENGIKKYASQIKLVKVDGLWIVDAASDNVKGAGGDQLLTVARAAEIKVLEFISEVGLAKTVEQLKEYLADQKNIQNEADKLGAGITQMILAGHSRSVFMWQERADPQNPGKYRKEFTGRFGFYADENGIKKYAPQIKLVKVGGLWIVDAASDNVKGAGGDQLLTVARAAEIKVVELISEVGLAKTVEQLKEYLADQKNIQNEADKLGAGITQMILAGHSLSVFNLQKRADPEIYGKQRMEFKGRFGIYADENGIKENAPQIKLVKVDGLWIVDAASDNVKGAGGDQLLTVARAAEIKVVELISEVGLAKTVEQLKEYLADQKNIQNEADKLGAGITQMILAGSSGSVFMWQERADPQNPGKQRIEFTGRFGFYADENGIKKYAPQIKLVKVGGLWIVDAASDNVKGAGGDQLLTVARAAEIKVVELISEVGLAKTVEQLKEYLADQKNIQNEADKLGAGITQMILAGSSGSVFMWKERANPQNPGKNRKEFIGSYGFYADENGIKENVPQIKLVKVTGLWVVDAAGDNVKGSGGDQLLTVARAAEIKVVELISEVGLAKTVEQLKDYLADQKNIQNEADKLGAGITQIILAGSSGSVFMWKERADPQNPGKNRKEFLGSYGFYADENGIKERATQIKLLKVNGLWIVDGVSAKGADAKVKLLPLVKSALAALD